MDGLTETGAEYLLHLERMVDAKYFGVREALQKAFEAGKTRGRIDGIDIAKNVIERKA